MGARQDRRRSTVAIIGAGTMGHGIALLAAKGGGRVRLVDVDEKRLLDAMGLIEAEMEWLHHNGELSSETPSEVMARIHPTRDLPDAISGCWLVIEAIDEDRGAKAELFERLCSIASAETIVASNTSYLNVFELAPKELLPRMLITHFYAPPHLIPLVEVVKAQETSPEVLEAVVAYLKTLGQRPVVMEKFIPGYIVNRLQRAMAREIFHLLDEGYATPEQIDEAVKASLGLRIPIVGVVQRYDFTGLDLALKFLQNPSIELVNEDRIPRALLERVRAGKLGVKTQEGFYNYRGKPLKEILLERDSKLLALRRFLGLT